MRPSRTAMRVPAGNRANDRGKRRTFASVRVRSSTVLYVGSAGRMIATIDGLTIHYGKRVAVDGLSFELAGGEIALLLGPNGAGKSTTLSAIAGTVMPSTGTITVAGD